MLGEAFTVGGRVSRTGCLCLGPGCLCLLMLRAWYGLWPHTGLAPASCGGACAPAPRVRELLRGGGVADACLPLRESMLDALDALLALLSRRSCALALVLRCGPRARVAPWCGDVALEVAPEGLGRRRPCCVLGCDPGLRWGLRLRAHSMRDFSMHAGVHASQ